MRKETKFFHHGHVRRPSWSPKVTTVLPRRALAMNPRYILVVSYQTSSNMVASAPSPLFERVGSIWWFLIVVASTVNLCVLDLSRLFSWFRRRVFVFARVLVCCGLLFDS